MFQSERFILAVQDGKIFKTISNLKLNQPFAYFSVPKLRNRPGFVDDRIEGFKEAMDEMKVRDLVSFSDMYLFSGNKFLEDGVSAIDGVLEVRPST